MCGISGILNLDQQRVNKMDILKMNAAISHRGPDNEGHYFDNYLGFGHQRLSIIDTSKRANQPMKSKDNKYVIVYNGEIYNFLELKKKLIKRGYVFKSNSDTEVVLYSWIEWKEKCVLKFNGMFAFSIWDIEKKNLFLARDRYGIKPLYYAFIKDSFIFSSEQKAIKKNKFYKFNANHEGIIEYFTFQNFYSDNTLDKNIKLFEPGYYAYINTNTKQLIKKKYWNFNFKHDDKGLDKFDFVEELDKLLTQAVKRQLISDVKLGTYLSGGIDSTLVTSIASKYINKLETFTCGFDVTSANEIELFYDERVRAQSISRFLKTSYNEYIVSAKSMEENLRKVIYHLEEPRVGQSYPNYLIAKFASKKVKVILSGTGGDELFCGYPWRYLPALSNKKFDKYLNDYYDLWKRLLTSKEEKVFFSPISEIFKKIDTKEIFYEKILHNIQSIQNKKNNFLNYSLNFEASTFLHGLLIVEDKLSMANSIETRLPFLDNDVVDFALKCPNKYKINFQKLPFKKQKNYKEINNIKTSNSKIILRKIINKKYKKNLVNINKQGFSAPDSTWFSQNSYKYISNILLKKNAKIHKYINKNKIKLILKEHKNKLKNRRLLIWSLLSVELSLTIK